LAQVKPLVQSLFAMPRSKHMGSKTSKHWEDPSMPDGEVPISEWMQWFVGAEEPMFIRSKEKFLDEGGDFKHPRGERSWRAGLFVQPTLEDLRRQVEQMEVTRPAKLDCALNVIDSTDIGYYQATFKTEDKVMVQIASNFHCLENGSPSCPPDVGNLVEGYCRDSTQGPAAAFGVPGASLVRAHYAFKVHGEDPSLWGQTERQQVNLLENLCKAASPAEHFVGDCLNGKARLLGEETHVTPDRIDEVASKIKVGLHEDAEVVFTRGSVWGSLKVVEERPLVDQACTATLCYGFANRLHNPPAAALENLTKAILRASYEGTYLAAIARGRRKLLLTLIGGASFRNPMPLILAELKRAHCKWASHPASQLEEVILVLYDKSVSDQYQKMLQDISC